MEGLKNPKVQTKFQWAQEFGRTVKPVLSSHSKDDAKYVFKTDNCLMQVENIAE